MLPRYAGSLFLALVLVCGVLSTLPFATRSQVRAGADVHETWTVDFTLRAPDNHYYTIDDELKAALQKRLTFLGSGAVQVRSTDVEITPRQVSWQRNKTNYTAPGARMVARVTWAAAADARDGDHGDVHIFFPKLPGIPSYTFVFHSGTHQKSSDGHWMFREVTVWRTAASAVFGRLLFVVGVALPIAILLHTIGWSIHLAREKKRRLEQLAPPPDAPALPRVFYPNPVVEWVAWVLILCIFAGIGLLPALIAICQGYDSTSLDRFILVTQLIGLVLGLIVALSIRATVITVRLDQHAIAYARGRGQPKWITARWAELRGATVKSMASRGGTTTWIELLWPDGKRRRVPDTVTDFQVLRSQVMELFARHH